MAEGYTSKNESKEEHDDKLNSFSAGSVFGGLGGSCHGRELSCDEMFVGGSEVDVKCVSILPTPSDRGGSCVRGSEVQEKAVMNENLRDICEGQSRTGWGNVEKKQKRWDEGLTGLFPTVYSAAVALIGVKREPLFLSGLITDRFSFLVCRLECKRCERQNLGLSVGSFSPLAL